MELWDEVPAEVRGSLRPMDYAEAYPPCGCDPETTPLRYLDLLAEAAYAARLCGSANALKIGKMALRLLEGEEDEDRDPLRSAWFWTERSRIVSGLGRSDGWDEIATAQELVKGLPPSGVHARILAVAAGWGMLHKPGPESLAAAERAVEYARLVKDESIELSARLTLGTLQVSAGDRETGLATMYEVRDRTRALGLHHESARAHVNLSHALENLGRSQEAVDVAEDGIRLTRDHGLLDSQGWIRSNQAESQFSLGSGATSSATASGSSRPGSGPSRAARRRCASPNWPSPGASWTWPPPSSPPPASTSARPTPCRSTPSPRAWSS